MKEGLQTGMDPFRGNLCLGGRERRTQLQTGAVGTWGTEQKVSVASWASWVFGQSGGGGDVFLCGDGVSGR